LDDLGTGDPSLRLIQDLELDKVNVDQSFVHFATDTGGSAVIVEGLARLGTGVGVQVVAELLEPLGYIPPAEAEANYGRQLAGQVAHRSLIEANWPPRKPGRCKPASAR